MYRLLARLGAVTAAGLALMLGGFGGGPAALAHVSVQSDGAEHGFAELAFRVPTESDTASTVKVQVAFPADAPLTEVAVLPHPGWTYQVSRNGAVSQIEWTASGSDTAIKPGEYEVFRVSAGPLPATGSLVFKVIQTYDDGQAVRWIDVPAAGGPEPEHPAAVLTLGSSAVATVAHVDAAAAAPAWWATGASGVALLVALVALLVALRPRRREGGDVS
jgi:periplasmic copper chaperone A